MPKSTKRTKKHNNLKHLSASAKLTLKDMAICYVMGVNASIVDMRTHRIQKPTPLLNSFIQKFKHKWKIYTVTFLEVDDEKKLEINKIEAFQEYYHSDLQDLIYEVNIGELAQHPIRHRCNVGWIAVPSGINLRSREIDKLMDLFEPYEQYVKGTLMFNEETDNALANQIRLLEQVTYQS